jgi:type II secretory ATPase GspE/PulE/Tfp pilus assembly ATPase PilB-like protein
MNAPTTGSPFHLSLEGLTPEDALRKAVEFASQLEASDLFLLIDEQSFVVAVRHLGVMRSLATIPVDSGLRLIRYVKAEAGMDIAERRRPQEGRLLFVRTDSAKIDLRINSVPTLYGEDLTLRLLSRETGLRCIDHLGLIQTQINELLAMLSSPGGLVLVTGPTGAGKTTTLYACLRHLHDGQRKINTIEDPIEYAVEGVRQSQVNPVLNVDFPDLLRAILRQAPDIIMIGEVRDVVTAETAVGAANSGQLVFATLHAPVAIGAIQSMLSLGVHPHFLSTSLLGVISQRLVRTLCPHCKVKIDLSSAPGTFADVAPWLEADQGQAMYAPGRCDGCRQEGFVGRTGVFEVLRPTQEIRQMIADSRPAREIAKQAIDKGMIEFRRSALLSVARGITSIEEVFRAVPSELLGVE